MPFRILMLLVLLSAESAFPNEEEDLRNAVQAFSNAAPVMPKAPPSMRSRPPEFIWSPPSPILRAPVGSSEVSYRATSYSIIPGSAEDKDWKKCDEIRSSYMAELMGFRELARDLHNLLFAPDFPGRADEIKKMHAKLKNHSDRLLYLAKPEWNIENRRWHLMWTLPGSEFFDDPEPDLGLTKLPPMKKGRIFNYKVGEVKLLGERRPDLREIVSVTLENGYFRDVEVRISKEATFLEFCQIARSIEIELSIDYVSPITLGIPYRTKYKLIFGEDL